MQISSTCVALVLGGGWEALIVGAVLVVAGAWLTFRAVRFFRGVPDCSCGSERKGCPAADLSKAIDRAMDTHHTKGS